MESPIFQRIRQYLKFKRISVTELSDVLKMKPSTLGGQLNGSRKLDIDALTAIIDSYPTLSVEWLFRGGEIMENMDLTPDPELKAVCIDQAKEIYRLKMRLAELEGEKKLA